MGKFKETRNDTPQPPHKPNHSLLSFKKVPEPWEFVYKSLRTQWMRRLLALNQSP